MPFPGGMSQVWEISMAHVQGKARVLKMTVVWGDDGEM